MDTRRGLIVSSLASLAASFIPSEGAGRWLKKIILIVLAIYTVCIIVFYTLCFILKNRVRRKSASRRSPIVRAVNHDQKAFESGLSLSPKSDVDEWVNVERDGAKCGVRGTVANSDYSGFIGLFHPFA